MSRKVLVVDDSRSILGLVRHVLERNNFEVETADNGAQALDKYTKFQPDVVLLDISMPVMDGYETMSRIRKLDPAAAIIMLTAIENEENMMRCLQKGAKAYLVKPIKNQELITAMNQIFDPDYDRYLNLFFYKITDRLDQSVKIMLGPAASVVLNDVRITRQRSPPTNVRGLDSSRIKAVPEITRPMMTYRREGTIGYVTKFDSMCAGIIIAFIDEKDLRYIISIQDDKGEQENMEKSKEAEFFNIVNMKILSELANYTAIKPVSTTRPFDESKDASPPFNQVSKTSFEIIIGARRMPLEIQLWTDIEQILGSKIRNMQL